MRVPSSVKRGLAAVELALLLPVLLLVLFGTIEYGWLFLKNQQLADAARNGARVAVTESGTNALVQARVAQVMSDAGLAQSGYLVQLTPANVATAAPGSTVTVEVTVAYANISLIGLPLIPVPSDLAERTSMVKEGSP